MGSVALSFVLFLVAPAVENTPKDSPAKCAVDGVVVKATTGQGVYKARVMLRKADGNSQQMYLATSDSGGRFFFQNLEPGSYALSADREGYVGQQYEQKMPKGNNGLLTLAAGESERNLTIRLVPASAISGQVSNEDGEPVQGAAVQVFRLAWWGGRRQFNFARSAQTDDLGAYRIFGIPPGKYFLNATYAGPPRVDGVLSEGDPDADQTYVPTYYPGTTDLTRALPVDVKPGEDLGPMDFTLLPVHGVRVRGQLINPAVGASTRGGCVNLMLRDAISWNYGFNRGACVQDEQGTFELRGVPPGAYIIFSNSFVENKNYTARLPVDVGKSGVEGITVALSPAFELKGHVGIEGNAQFKLSDIYLSLHSIDQPTMGVAGSRVDSEGGFTLQNVSDGTYRVVVGSPCADCYVKNLRLGSELGADDAITVNRDHFSDALEVSLSAAAARLEGIAVNDEGKPSSNAMVVLIPEMSRRNSPDLYKTWNTGANGEFAFSGIPPGEYKVFAWSSAEGVAFHDPDWLATFENRGMPIRLVEGDRQKVQVRVIPLGSPAF